jgi:hypothetical protein
MSTTPLIPRGPWVDRAAVEEILGRPIEEWPVKASRQGCSALALLPVGMLAVISCCFLGVWVYEILTERGLRASDVWGIPLWLLILGGGGYAGWRILGSGLALRHNRLLIGTRGFAEWTTRGATIVLWDDLGIHWQVTVPGAQPGELSTDVYLTLEHSSGVLFQLTRLYSGAKDLRDRILETLRRNLVAMGDGSFPQPVVDLTRADPSSRESVTDEPYPPVPDGPWLDSDAARSIGPVLLVAAPSRRGRRTWLVRTCLVTFAGLLVGGLFAFLLGAFLYDQAYGDANADPRGGIFPFVVAASAFVMTGQYLHRQLLSLRPRFLLGRRGLALWNPGGSIVIPWDALVTEWRTSVRVTKYERFQLVLPVLLKLRRTDGFCLFITELYEHAPRIVERVLDELHRRSVLSIPTSTPRERPAETGPTDIVPPDPGVWPGSC